MQQKFNVANLLDKVVEMGVSDLHLGVGVSPVVRINTALTPLSDISPLTVEDVEYFISQILNQQHSNNTP